MKNRPNDVQSPDGFRQIFIVGNSIKDKWITALLRMVIVQKKGFQLLVLLHKVGYYGGKKPRIEREGANACNVDAFEVCEGKEKAAEQFKSQREVFEIIV